VVWDDYYGPMSPGEILGKLGRLAEKVTVAQAAAPAVDVPPELEREVTALRALHRRVVRLRALHNARNVR